MIHHGDSLEVLKELEDNSVDAIVTDPPYGLAFMGKKWDYDVPSVELWREALRVLKPGGHLLSFGGTRTYHRMVVNIEDAGFEIRDQIQWLYGSGFPKSLDVSKAIDKAAGAEREVVGERTVTKQTGGGRNSERTAQTGANRDSIYNFTALATPDAIKWQGWGTALKPANEPIVLARKPLSESTVAKNVLKHGTGGINVDGCRVELAERGEDPRLGGKGQWNIKRDASKHTVSMPAKTMGSHAQGRFPANLILDEEAARLLDEQSGKLSKGHWPKVGSTANEIFGKRAPIEYEERHPDSGGASRFFYCAKAIKSERGEGNGHPTVKPIKLMRYLCRLITPPQGIVLDPFCGSGSTGVAAREEGFQFIGIEREAEYVEIARRRYDRQTR